MSETLPFSTYLTEASRGLRPFQAGDPVMDNWEVVRKIGSGGYGTVYEIRKNQLGVEYRSALKVIPIPREADYTLETIDEAPMAYKRMEDIIDAISESSN